MLEALGVRMGKDHESIFRPLHPKKPALALHETSRHLNATVVDKPTMTKILVRTVREVSSWFA